MTEFGDRPSAQHLLATVADLLRDTVQPAVDGALSYEVRVAVNALTIAARELAQGSDLTRAHAGRLADLGFDDDDDLCGALQAGSLDDRYAAVVRALRQDVWDRLQIVNPGYASPFDDPLTAFET